MSWDPSWPDEDEWDAWGLADPRDPFETRKHKALVLFERRCRHCKSELRGLPPEECSRLECQAMNVLGDYEATSFKQLA